VRRGKRLPLEELAPYLLAVPELPASLRWADMFGNDRPVEVEVGFGKGLFLVTAGQASPDTNFLGVEIDRAYQLFTATRLAKRRLTNVRLACADARTFFRDCLPAASVQAVRVYFPDPWWKKRHKKRRVFTPEFVRECERVLRPGGVLHVATDVEEYFGVIGELVTGCTGLRPLPMPDEPAREAAYLTNFERKAQLRGRPVFRAAYGRPL
jgi:tRNA (guanine-N7-)-methyltransferase